MLRDRSLIPLSHQHQHALALCVLTDRALAAGADVETQARAIVSQFDDEIRGHFEIEEGVLFPMVAGSATEGLIEELLAEHSEMTALAGRLREAPDASLITQFTALLRRHVRKEEKILFEDTQRQLSREQLDRLGEQIASAAQASCASAPARHSS